MLSLLIIMLLASLLAIFLGSSAIIEKDQFTLVFTAAGLRIISVLGLVLFVVFFIRRSFEARDMEFLLSRPVSRLTIIFSYGIAFSCMAILMGLAASLVVYSVTPHLFGYGHILWGFSIVFENIIMVNIALFFAMHITSSSSASLVTLGFYVLARMMGQFLGIIDSNLVDNEILYPTIMQVISVITPRLDLMGQTSWLIYGASDGDISLLHILAQGIVFPVLVLFAAALDFARRQF